MSADFIWDLVLTLAGVVVATIAFLVLAEVAHTQRSNKENR